MLKGKFSVEVRQDEISEKIGLQLKEFLLSSHLTEDVEIQIMFLQLVEMGLCFVLLINIWIS